MAEVLVKFESEFKAPDGKLYGASACGRGRDDGLWEGWLEFTPFGGGETIRTERETTQPNRDNALYWATGLTTTYIEGALLRTLTPPPVVSETETPAASAFSGPAPHVRPQPPGINSFPILDPFRVYAEGADVLRGQLNALPDDQLRMIVRAHAIADSETANRAGRQELISLIMVAVEKRAA